MLADLRSRTLTRLVAIGIAALIVGCGGSAPGSTGAGTLPPAELSVAAFSTPQVSYERLTEAFRQTPQGRNITFVTSFGSSGDQRRAVEAGLRADIVHLAIESDITPLVKAGIIAEDWNKNQYRGMLTSSHLGFGVRRGNPKGIKAWADLVKPGIQVITPNPASSGGARWNLLAAYGQATRTGASHDQAVAYLTELFRHVPVLDASAREALQTFVSGKGDAMLAYDNEIIFAREASQPVELVIPAQTILIENPAAITKSSRFPEQAKAFLDFLYSSEGQAIFTEQGYHPVVAGVKSRFDQGKPSGLFTIDDLGGWATQTPRFFDPNGIFPDILKRIGASR